MAFSTGRGMDWISLALLLPLAAPAFAQVTKEPKSERLWVYVGTYTQRGSQGIYRFELDLSSGKLTSRVLAAETTNPSFLAIDPERHFLYAVSEVTDFDGKKTGGVGAFAIDPKSGDLSVLNQQPSGGAG